MRGGGPIVAGVLIVLTAACGGSSPARPAANRPTPALDTTPVTLAVGQLPDTIYAPLYVAMARGYFSQLGVTVQLPTIRPGQRLVDLVSRGQVDVALTDFSADLLNAIGHGQKLTVVGSMAEMPSDGSRPIALEVAKALLDSGKVTAAADLKGHTIVIDGGAGSGEGYLAQSLLQPAGVSLKDMTVGDVAAASMESGMATGGVDSALAPAPYSTSIEQHGAGVPLVAPPPGTTWSGVVYGSRVTASAGVRFLLALARAARSLVGGARTSPDTVAALARYTGRTPDQLAAMPAYAWDPNLKPNPAVLAAVQSTFREEGLLTYDADVPAAKLVDGSYARRVATIR